MKTIHIEGWAKDLLNPADWFSDRYELDVSFAFYEESTETIPRVFFRFYSCVEKCPLEQAIRGSIRFAAGDLTLTGEEYGYSEYTVEGFTVSEAKLGGHDLLKIIQSHAGSYLHILIDQVPKYEKDN